MAAVTLTLRLSEKPRMGTRTRAAQASAMAGPDALALVAEDDGEPGHRGEVLRGEGAFGVSADEGHAFLARPGKERLGAGVAHEVDPLLRAPRDAPRRQEGRPGTLDDVEPLHAEGLAGADDRRAVVRVVRPVEHDRDARQARADDGVQAAPSGVAHERLEHADDVLRAVCVDHGGAGVEELASVEHA